MSRAEQHPATIVKTLPGDMRRKFQLIHALDTLNRPSLEDLHAYTGIARPTIKRHISSLRAEFRMDIRFVRETGGSPGAVGYYVLSDWGILSEERFTSLFTHQNTGLALHH